MKNSAIPSKKTKDKVGVSKPCSNGAYVNHGSVSFSNSNIWPSWSHYCITGYFENWKYSQEDILHNFQESHFIEGEQSFCERVCNLSEIEKKHFCFDFNPWTDRSFRSNGGASTSFMSKISHIFTGCIQYNRSNLLPSSRLQATSDYFQLRPSLSLLIPPLTRDA